ncbi:nuclear transport factor 2 family protein [Parahaliea sp. F7430]|uniref:Nuclear transport factor 2 family protein n=1 Tax=Sediminihaliea albiluteola TaxID=2758564 RepID=A0A7W2TWB1_9GAMM|nr:nuclear transport factor 2 family protein [Sediminihaliea albiluteola]MBA6413130.1 nuclear transport factor 2 family protein [Sediminihaliea albiluteola]
MDKAFFESYYETYNSEDAEALRAFYHDEVELISAQGVIRGPDQIIAVYRDITANFIDQMTPQDISFKDGFAYIQILDRFTAKREVEDFMGMAFTKGQSFELNIRAVYEVVDNKIIKASLSLE